jgi:hypothetical protein
MDALDYFKTVDRKGACDGIRVIGRHRMKYATP